jgi:plasmid stabilization system protein ParE
MKYEIIFSQTALSTLDDLKIIIEEKWGQKVANTFLSNTWRVLSLIEENPFLFKKSENRPEIRLGMVDRHTSFLYEVGENKVHILCFWNNKVQPFL